MINKRSCVIFFLFAVLFYYLCASYTRNFVIVNFSCFDVSRFTDLLGFLKAVLQRKIYIFRLFLGTHEQDWKLDVV